ncbi:MAG: hypothetical protein Kow0069_17170 [Promethearchaeota archaeon]
MPTVVKIYVAGEGGVGKTTLIKRFCERKFHANTQMTIGVEFAVKSLERFGGLTLQIWDLGGEDRFRFIIPNYVKGAMGGLLVFDLTRYLTFMNLEEWIKLLQQAAPGVPVILVGTKADSLDAGEQSVDQESVDELVREKGMVTFVKTSSKTGLNVDWLFSKLVISMFPQHFGGVNIDDLWNQALP